MALKKTFDLGDITFGEEKEAMTEPVKEESKPAPKKDTAKAEEKTEPVPVPETIEEVVEEKSSAASSVTLISKKKNLKTEHKNFLFDKDLADQLKKVAKKTGLSENEVVSQILKQTLSQLLDD